MTRDPASGLATHDGPAGGPIVLPVRDRWAPGGCRGELRALYVRLFVVVDGAPKKQGYYGGTVKKPRWTRAGYVCLRCGVVELHAGVLPVDDPKSWQRASESNTTRPGAILAPSTAAVDTASPATRPNPHVPCPTCGASVNAGNMARHRRAKHEPREPRYASSDRRRRGNGVDTLSIEPRRSLADGHAYFDAPAGAGYSVEADRG